MENDRAEGGTCNKLLLLLVAQTMRGRRGAGAKGRGWKGEREGGREGGEGRAQKPVPSDANVDASLAGSRSHS